MVGDTIPRLVVLGSIRKQAEQARRSKPINNTSSWTLHQLLPVDPVLTFFSDDQQ